MNIAERNVLNVWLATAISTRTTSTTYIEMRNILNAIFSKQLFHNGINKESTVEFLVSIRMLLPAKKGLSI